MKNLGKYLILLFACLFLFGFRIKEELPEKWNKDFSFILFNKGGMRPVNCMYRIYMDSCVFEKDDVINKVKEKKKIRFSKRDKKKLLDVLRQNNALSIRSVHLHGQPIYDKPSYGFIINNKGRKHQVVSGELEEIEAPNKERFEAIYSYARSVLEKKK